jgi:hypothetical protein
LKAKTGANKLSKLGKISKIRLNSGKEVSINSEKSIYFHDLNKISTPGLYTIISSGSFYLYFDGKEWFSEYAKPMQGSELRQGFLVLDYS